MDVSTIERLIRQGGKNRKRNTVNDWKSFNAHGAEREVNYSET